MNALTLLRRLSPLLAVLVLATGCASTGTGSGEGQDVLTSADLVEYSNRTAYDAVRQLRPIWLNARRGDANAMEAQDKVGRFGRVPVTEDIQSPRGIRVYVDGVEAREGIEDLKGIRADQVMEMRKLDAQEASMKHGIGHSSGAIAVTLKR